MYSKLEARILVLSCCLAWASCGPSPKGGVTTVASSLYARSDTNATTVWSPRLHVVGRLGESTGVDTAIALDSWTGASIDVTTAATSAVHEIRKEITAGGFYEFEDVTLAGGYRYSTENDYWSSGGVASLTIDMANNNTTLGIAGFGSKDTVGRSGDPGFRKPQSSIGGRLSLTQVLDTESLLQLSWETTGVEGYQAGPYRFVAVGGAEPGLCAGSAPYCLPEMVPRQRIRSAGIGTIRRALGGHASFGASYRFYFDDWGVLSHTLSPDLAWLVSEHGTLSLSYRYYTQDKADFYRSRYLGGLDDVSYLTRDRELSTMYSHRIGLGYSHEIDVGEEGGAVLTTAFRGGVTRYIYLAFVGLEQVDALESTLLLSLDWL